jgi:hypothetical protein
VLSAHYEIGTEITARAGRELNLNEGTQLETGEELLEYVARKK